MPRDSRPNGPNSFDRRARGLDGVNLRLLSELQDNPRLSMSELARRVGMSAPAVTERVRSCLRLEAAGVIVGYRLEVDPAALGMPVAALVRIRPGPGQLLKIARLAHETTQVVECHRITGEDCFILKIQHHRSANSKRSSTDSSSSGRRPPPSWSPRRYRPDHYRCPPQRPSNADRRSHLG